LPARQGRSIPSIGQRFLDSGHVVQRDYHMPLCNDRLVGLSPREGLDPELDSQYSFYAVDHWRNRVVVCGQACETWCARSSHLRSFRGRAQQLSLYAHQETQTRIKRKLLSTPSKRSLMTSPSEIGRAHV